jgi:hypothetical protein
VSYDGLIEFGRQVASEGNSSDRIFMHGEILWHALAPRRQEFWANWSVLTGVPLPPGFEQKGFHSSMCRPSEVYYWFGIPDESDSAE